MTDERATDAVTTDVVVTENGRSGRGRRTTLRLHWHAAEPLAVSLRLSARPDHPALPRGEWTVLRDFLRYGLEEQTGDGDVRIAPNAAQDVVVLELTQQQRPCRVAIARDTVRAFLEATDAVVPSGEERSDEAIDALIDRLLDT